MPTRKKLKEIRKKPHVPSPEVQEALDKFPIVRPPRKPQRQPRARVNKQYARTENDIFGRGPEKKGTKS